MLYLIGTGLGDEKDITLRGSQILKSCDYIYLENYTNYSLISVKKLEKLYGKKVILADRELVEQNSKDILNKSKDTNVAFLVIGDVFAATTHVDLFLRAKSDKIDVKVIHNVSILTAVSDIGLDLYKYGKTTSLPFNHTNIKTPLNVIDKNKSLGLHTLLLLDLDPKNNKFLTINEACKYLINNNISKNTLVIGCSALGTKNMEIRSGSLNKLKKFVFLQYPQCLIIPGELHFIEKEMITLWK